MFGPDLRSRARLGTVLGAVVGIAVSLAVAGRGEVLAVERHVGRWIYDLPGWTTPVLEAVMQAGTRATIVAVAIGVLLATRRWGPPLAVFAVGALSWATADLMKEAVDRARPTQALLGRAIRESVEKPGYPSTHAAVAAGLAAGLTFSLSLPRSAVATVWGIAALTAVARVHLGVHWLLDVLAGVAIGALAGALLGPLGRRSEQQPAVTDE